MTQGRSATSAPTGPARWTRPRARCARAAARGARARPAGCTRAGGRAGNRQDTPPFGAGGSCRGARTPGSFGVGVGARARAAVFGLCACVGRVRREPRPQPALDPRRRRGGRARTSCPRCRRSQPVARWRSSTSGIEPSSGARAARTACAEQAARACARRLPLGRPRLGRAAGRTVAPAAGGGSAHRRCAPPAPNAGASCSSARAGAPCGGADSGRARRAHAG